MKVSTKDLLKQNEEIEDGFTLQIALRAMQRDAESVVEKFSALVLPALDYALPRNSKEIQELARAHAREENEVLVKTHYFMPPENMLKVILELGEIRKAISKFEKISPTDTEAKEKARVMHQIIDVFLENWKRRADPST